ncbi:HlyD family efflux transporter periplasmic adaptor subunit [Ruegeria sp. HU-ET01832]|uniref:HlyD family efflux transporter periplasmic adaptor subunit n=1 Tax=Ruegeria sp. HU-ET01832 TaxID=3135906 RepID=UPI003341964C
MNSNLPHRADADTTYEGKMTKEPESRTPTHELQADAAYKSKLQKWIDRKMRRWAGTGLAGGLGSTLLALPALAQATVEELYAFQFAETIPGVRSVKLLKDGDVVLKLANGQTIVVAAEKVQILEGGAIMIAEDAVAEIAQFSLAAEAGGAASAGGISGVGAALGGLGLAGAAAAGAGGGGGGDSAPPPAPTYPHLNLSGVQSTALSSAALNINAAEGAESVQVTIGSFVAPATLNSDGTWSLSLSPAQAANLPQGVTNVVVRSLDVDGNEITTIGGLARSGEELIELVPLGDNLLVEAYVRPDDIAFLHAGQPVKVKITAYDFARYGALDGEIVRIGANTITRSERNDEEVFVVEIQTQQSFLDANGVAVEIIPGMIAEVDILAGRKTVMEYLIRPVVKVKEQALRE